MLTVRCRGGASVGFEALCGLLVCVFPRCGSCNSLLESSRGCSVMWESPWTFFLCVCLCVCVCVGPSCVQAYISD